jgi:hypothetical protein
MTDIIGTTTVEAQVPAQTVLVRPVEIDAPPNTTAEQDRESAGRRLADKLAAETLGPKTTAEEDRRAAGQREINKTWELTQRQIALAVIFVSLIVGGVLSIFGKVLGTSDVQLAAIVFLFGVANLVTGFYFGRTNHARSGGIGGDSVQGSR